MTEVIVKGKVDPDAMPDESLLPFAVFVTEAAKVFFGKPESAAKLEEWRRRKAA